MLGEAGADGFETSCIGVAEVVQHCSCLVKTNININNININDININDINIITIKTKKELMCPYRVAKRTQAVQDRTVKAPDAGHVGVGVKGVPVATQPVDQSLFVSLSYVFPSFVHSSYFFFFVSSFLFSSRF